MRSHACGRVPIEIRPPHRDPLGKCHLLSTLGSHDCVIRPMSCMLSVGLAWRESFPKTLSKRIYPWRVSYCLQGYLQEESKGLSQYGAGRLSWDCRTKDKESTLDKEKVKGDGKDDSIYCLLYKKMYEMALSNGELMAKSARVFAYEHFVVVAIDPKRHMMAWVIVGWS